MLKYKGLQKEYKPNYAYNEQDSVQKMAYNTIEKFIGKTVNKDLSDVLAVLEKVYDCNWSLIDTYLENSQKINKLESRLIENGLNPYIQENEDEI